MAWLNVSKDAEDMIPTLLREQEVTYPTDPALLALTIDEAKKTPPAAVFRHETTFEPTFRSPRGRIPPTKAIEKRIRAAVALNKSAEGAPLIV